MKKVFVTGADGMLGSSICRELLFQGYVVKAICLAGRNINTKEKPVMKILCSCDCKINLHFF